MCFKDSDHKYEHIIGKQKLFQLCSVLKSFWTSSYYNQIAARLQVNNLPLHNMEAPVRNHSQ